MNRENVNFWLQDDKIQISRLKLIPNNFKYISCFICNFLLPFDKSEACSYCGIQTCSSCINKYAQVNDGKCANTKCDRLYKNMILLRSKVEELEELEVVCRFNKCGEYVKYKELRIHEGKCIHREFECPGCNKNFHEVDYVNHSQCCTENLICCMSCGFSAKFKDLVNHSCELFLYIRNQIRNEYLNENEKLKKEIVQDVIHEILPQITSYVNTVMASNSKATIDKKKNETVTDNYSFISNVLEENINDINIELISENNYEKEVEFENENKLLNKKHKDNSDLKFNSSLIKNFKSEAEEIPSHNLFTRSNKKIMDLKTDSAVKINDSVIKIKVAHDITCLALIDGLIIYGTDEGSIHSYDIVQEKPLKSHTEHKQAILSLKEYPESNFVSSSNDMSVKFWNVHESKSLFTIQQNYFSLCVLLTDYKWNTFPSDFTQMITGDCDGTIRLWKKNTKEVVHEFKGQHVNVTCIKLITCSNGVTYLLSGGSDCKIIIWNMNTYHCEKTYYCHKAAIRSILSMRDDKFISCSEDGQVIIYKMEDKECYWPLYKFKSSVNDFVILENNTLFCAYKNIIKIIDVDKKDVVKEKFTKEKIYKLILIEKDNQIMCYNRMSKNVYIYSYSTNEL